MAPKRRPGSSSGLHRSVEGHTTRGEEVSAQQIAPVQAVVVVGNVLVKATWRSLSSCQQTGAAVTPDYCMQLEVKSG